MLFRMTCETCHQKVFGVFSSLRKVNGHWLCETCAPNPERYPMYYCNCCHNYSPTAIKKGNGWIELVLYLFYLIPGLIYSLWRRSDAPNVCPVCRAPGLILASQANKKEVSSVNNFRDEIECPFCAEKILAKANLCKHCGKQVRILTTN